ncbi:MAG: S8 family serine peptidase [Clostridiaceae bacterium]|nr:S8 family serine peptidase [Clostridiaceae bacterium]
MKRIYFSFVLVIALLVMGMPVSAAGTAHTIGVNVVLNTKITASILSDLNGKGQVLDVLDEINALSMRIRSDRLAAVRALPYVAAANPDAARRGSPIDTVAAADFSDGLSTWNLDAINVTDYGYDNRTTGYDGSGVYVAVLDTGLVDSWRQYFPEEQIAVNYARSFSGGGGEKGNVSEQPNKWEHDQDSHGTHVTSTILGYNLNGSAVNGVAPMATIIPVKVLNQNGSGWSSVIARGILYIAELKAGSLADYPVVINMSLGGSGLDALEKAAIDYAIAQGVIIVASAGNEGTAGMGYPGAYAPVISVAAAGWRGEWPSGENSWWYDQDVGDPTAASDFYITSFSSRALSGQDLDVAAPGSWIVGPYQVNSGHLSYYFLGGTSMASPHVAGLTALMLQKDPDLTAAEAEDILESSATPLPAGSCSVRSSDGTTEMITWGADATGSGLANAVAALDLVP